MARIYEVDFSAREKELIDKTDHCTSCHKNLTPDDDFLQTVIPYSTGDELTAICRPCYKAIRKQGYNI